MESGEIADAQISASSNFQVMTPQRSRLYYEDNDPVTLKRRSCWGPRHEIAEEWLQIDLLDLHTITAIMIQGDGTEWRHYWVETYRLNFTSSVDRGDDGTDDVWLTYRELNGDEKVLRYLNSYGLVNKS